MPIQENLDNLGMQVLTSHNLVHTFTIEYNGKQFTFSCRPQGVSSTFAIVSRSQQILKQFGIDSESDPMAKDLAYEIATLETMLVNRPPEFADFMNLPPELDDWDLIHRIYQEVAKFLISFRKSTATPPSTS